MSPLGKTYPSYRPVKLARNNHDHTAIDQFSKIKFTEKWLSTILKNDIFLCFLFPYMIFFSIFSKYFF